MLIDRSNLGQLRLGLGGPGGDSPHDGHGLYGWWSEGDRSGMFSSYCCCPFKFSQIWPLSSVFSSGLWRGGVRPKVGMPRPTKIWSNVLAYQDLAKRHRNLVVFDDFIFEFQKSINSPLFATIFSDNLSFMRMGEVAYPFPASSLTRGSVCNDVKPNLQLLFIGVFGPF